MWDHYHLWVSTTQIQRGRGPTTGDSYANTVVCRCSWRSNEWPITFPRWLSAVLSDFSRSALFLTCYYYISTINYVFARVGKSLFQVRCFQVPTPMPFPLRVHKLLLRRGHIRPTLLRNSRPKFVMEANQPFQQGNIIKTPPCVAAPKSDRGRVSTS